MSKKTKKIILIVLLLIAIIFGLYKIITYQEKTFNKDLELNENIIVNIISSISIVGLIRPSFILNIF